MKIGMKEVLSGISYSAEQKLKKELQEMGFKISDDKICDIFAEKGDDRRLYELRVGKYKMQKRVFYELQAYAKEKKAKLYIVYLEVPKTTEVEFEGIEDILFRDFENNTPTEIDSLSTHAYMESVDNVSIDSISILSYTIKVAGTGTLNLELQYGSRSDLKNDNGWVESQSVDFFFRIEVDNDRRIRKRYYKFDVSGI